MIASESLSKGTLVRETDDLVAASKALTRVPLIEPAVAALASSPAASVIHGLRLPEGDPVHPAPPTMAALLKPAPLVEEVWQAAAVDLYLWLVDEQGNGRVGADMPAISLALICETPQGSVREVCMGLELDALDRLHEMMIPMEMMGNCASRILTAGGGYDALELCILREANLPV